MNLDKCSPALYRCEQITYLLAGTYRFAVTLQKASLLITSSIQKSSCTPSEAFLIRQKISFFFFWAKYVHWQNDACPVWYWNFMHLGAMCCKIFLLRNPTWKKDMKAKDKLYCFKWKKWNFHEEDKVSVCPGGGGHRWSKSLEQKSLQRFLQTGLNHTALYRAGLWLLLSSALGHLATQVFWGWVRTHLKHLGEREGVQQLAFMAGKGWLTGWMKSPISKTCIKKARSRHARSVLWKKYDLNKEQS